MELQPLDVILLEGRREDIAEGIIMLFSNSAFSHCVTVKNERGDIFDATIGGILDRNISYYADRYKTICRFKDDIPKEKIEQMLQWGEEKQKTCEGYDILAWLGFGTGIKYFESEDRWYCSEVPYWMFIENGYCLTGEEMTFIYPNFFLYDDHFKTILWEKEVK